MEVCLKKIAEEQIKESSEISGITRTIFEQNLGNVYRFISGRIYSGILGVFLSEILEECLAEYFEILLEQPMVNFFKGIIAGIREKCS